MDLALEAAQKHTAGLYTLGPLIHNPQAVQHLEQLGVKARKRIEEIPGGTVILRSHGVRLEDLKKARKRKLRIVDATCPIVKKAQFYAKFLHRHGYAVMIVGDPYHPEVEAIRSYIPGEIEVVQDVIRVRELGPWEKLGIIAQTTQSFALFKEVVAATLDHVKNVRIFNTICHATTARQKEAVSLAKKVDCMIVIGGFNSGNTQRLVSICREVQPKTHHIECAKEIFPRWFVGKKRIGVTAGASTPPWIIKEVEALVRRMTK